MLNVVARCSWGLVWFAATSFSCLRIWIWQIPKKYIVARWTRGALVNPIHSYDGMAGNEFVADDENNLLMSKIVSEFYKCLGFVDGNTEQMSK